MAVTVHPVRYQSGRVQSLQSLVATIPGAVGCIRTPSNSYNGLLRSVQYDFCQMIDKRHVASARECDEHEISQTPQKLTSSGITGRTSFSNAILFLDAAPRVGYGAGIQRFNAERGRTSRSYVAELDHSLQMPAESHEERP